MIVTAKAKFLRVSPKKLRRIANLIRNKRLDEAIAIVKYLRITNKKYFEKLLNSVMANARIKNPDLREKDFEIVRLVVNEGPRIRRMKPRARGRADIIKRRISHIEIVVSSGEKEKKEEEK